MSDTQSTDAATAEDQVADETQDEPLGEPGKRALDRERADRKAAQAERDALAARVQAFEDAQKTETERAAEALAAATANTQRLEAANLRLTVLNRHAIPGEYADFVHGATEEALEASAEKLQALLSNRTSNTGAHVVHALDKPAPASVAGQSIQDQLKAAAASGDTNAETQLKLLSLGD